MATKQSTIEYIEDQLADVPGIHSCKMFGSYALYCGDKVVALVCDDQLFVKITEEGRICVGEGYEEGRAYPGPSHRCISMRTGSRTMSGCANSSVSPNAIYPLRNAKPKSDR